MKIAITGHTRGIGKALAFVCTQQGHEVVGFSKSQGYDISIEDTRNQILQKMHNVDVFINNAYTPNGQTQLLLSMIELWKNTANTIVNINSKSSLANVHLPFMRQYAKDKTEQKKIITSRFFNCSPHIMDVTLGVVDTDLAKVFESKKMDPLEIANLILHLISLRNVIACQDILLDVPNLNWNDIKFKGPGY